MTTKNFRFKSHAFQNQAGRCYYCDLPMWLDHPEHFALRFDITVPQSKQFQCTAEHLVARQEGGATSQSNIVAACLFCNQKRHQRKIALSPVKHKERIKKRLSVQKWHPFFSAKLLYAGDKKIVNFGSKRADSLTIIPGCASPTPASTS
ncbi:MAG: HNH endonuclease [Candidatus Competibacter sp.]|nr:HNH endonuclease [Candidatus Competibacter sp.]